MSVCAPRGFRAAGVAGGIKPGGELDCAAVLSDVPAVGAGVFTTNLVKAAPVLVSEKHLADPTTWGIVLSSGNANAATGAAGIDVAESMCTAAAEVHNCAPDTILIAQTGLIGIPLDKETAVGAVHAASRAVNADGAASAARAMMTTDTVAKLAVARTEIGATPVAVGGIAKGAAMLKPSMATMLAALTTDVSIAAAPLRSALVDAMSESFHAILVDDMSTNDTVFLVANGASAAPMIDSTDHPDYPNFAGAVAGVCRSLALAMVEDAEGATKLLEMSVAGAASAADARLAARAVCASTLVKCSLAGEDPYWGRILSELGASGASFDPSDVSIAYGGHVVCRRGEAADHDGEAVAVYMQGARIEVTANLGVGSASAVAYGSDLTHAYVDENMGTS